MQNHKPFTSRTRLLSCLLSMFVGATSAQTLSDLAASQSAKQEADMKKNAAASLIKPAAASDQAIPLVPTSGTGGLGSAIKFKPVVEKLPPPPTPKGPVVHSIVKRGGELRIELADKGRLMLAKVGMEFGKKRITQLSVEGVTISDASNLSDEPSKSTTTKNPSRKASAKNKADDAANNTAVQPRPVVRTVGLGGAL